MLPPPYFTVWDAIAWFSPSIHAKEFSQLLIRPEKFVYLGLGVLRLPFWQTPGRLPCAFLLRSGRRLTALPNGPDWWIAEIVVLLEGSSLSSGE